MPLGCLLPPINKSCLNSIYVNSTATLVDICTCAPSSLVCVTVFFKSVQSKLGLDGVNYGYFTDQNGVHIYGIHVV